MLCTRMRATRCWSGPWARLVSAQCAGYRPAAGSFEPEVTLVRCPLTTKRISWRKRCATALALDLPGR
ncbi:MAG: hypothetical protein WKG07_10670 [Hymenobacter sp.]